MGTTQGTGTRRRPLPVRLLRRDRPSVEPLGTADPDGEHLGPTSAADLGTTCLAPIGGLYFMTNGDVRTCCMNAAYPLGNVGEQRLREIWDGTRRRLLVEAIADGDFSLGCQPCEWQGNHEGIDNTYARRYDEFAPAVAALAPEQWPVHLEFNLSNACNLQCIQCHGELSSSIRIHREKLPALPRVYDDQFFEDLVPFLAHATDIQVAGGEPFLGTENLRLWDLIVDHAPDARCNVVTNGTQWNDRVQRIIEAVPMNITISIDGISKAVYEPIRVGSDFDRVLENIDHFVDYARRVGTTLTFNHCLMVQNYHELGDLLVFAEERDISVNISVVYTPSECSLGDLDAEALGRVCDELEALEPSVLPRLHRNAATWTEELTRLRTWHRFRDQGDRHEPIVAFPVPDRQTIAGLNRRGAGPVGEDLGRAALARHATGEIRSFTLGVDDTIARCGPGAAAALGTTDEALVGRPAESLQELLAERFGLFADVEVLEADDDHVVQVVTYGTTRFHAVNVALRDDKGRADEVQVLFIDPTSADAG